MNNLINISNKPGSLVESSSKWRRILEKNIRMLSRYKGPYRRFK